MCVKLLRAQLDKCRWHYNQLREQRKLAHEELDISLFEYKKSIFLPLSSDERPMFAQVSSELLNNVVDLLNKVSRFFYRGCQGGEKSKFPRFRGWSRCISFFYLYFSFNRKKLNISSIGIKMDSLIRDSTEAVCMAERYKGTSLVGYSRLRFKWRESSAIERSQAI